MLNFYFEALSIEGLENDSWFCHNFVDAVFEVTKKEWSVDSPHLETSLQILELASQIDLDCVLRPIPSDEKHELTHIKKITELVSAGNLNRACVYLVKEIQGGLTWCRIWQKRNFGLKKVISGYVCHFRKIFFKPPCIEQHHCDDQNGN